MEKVDGRMGVAVVDVDETSCAYFENILQNTSDFQCAGCFSNPEAALREIPAQTPDLALIDIRLPEMNGIECAKQLKRALPRLKVVMTTASSEADLVQKAMDAGADAFLTKPVTPEQFLAALRFAVAKRSKEDAETIQPSSATLSRVASLTVREQQVMSGLADGLLYKEIAERMQISFSAVHKHQHNVFRKLKVTNRTEAVRTWLAAGQSSR